MSYFDTGHPDSEEHIEDLKRSVAKVGHLEPAIRNKRTGHIISGSHRLAADSSWPVEEVDVDEFEEEIRMVHYNLQRRMPQSETAAHIRRLLEMLEARGTPRQECFKAMLDQKIFPYGEDYIRSLAPKDYIRGYEQRSPNNLSRAKTTTRTLADAIQRVVKMKADGQSYGFILQQMNPQTGKPFYQEIQDPAKFTDALNKGIEANTLLVIATSVTQSATESPSHRQLLECVQHTQTESNTILRDEDGLQYRVYVIKEEGKPVRFDGEQV